MLRCGPVISKRYLCAKKYHVDYNYQKHYFTNPYWLTPLINNRYEYVKRHV